jgi:hypothetical protein
MPNFERITGRREQSEEANSLLSRYGGLRQTLYALCGPHKEREAAPLTFSDVIKVLSENADARSAVRFYLLAGEGHQRDGDVSEWLDGQIAWSLVDDLSRKLAANESSNGRI